MVIDQCDEEKTAEVLQGALQELLAAEGKLEQIRGAIDYIIVEDVHHEIIHKRKAPLAFLIFSGLIASASAGLADIMVCAITALFLMILTGCLQLRDAYRSLQADVLMLIVGAIATGESTCQRRQVRSHG